MTNPNTPFFEQTSSLVAGGLVVILLAGGQFFLWRYAYGLAQELHASQTNEQQIQLLSQKLTGAQTGLLAEQRKLADLSSIFPSKETISQVVGRIESLADSKQLSLEITSIEDGDPVEAGDEILLAKVFSLNAQGSADSLFAFLEALEHQKELVHIDAWSVTSESSSQESNLFVLTLKVTYYFYDPSY